MSDSTRPARTRRPGNGRDGHRVRRVFARAAACKAWQEAAARGSRASSCLPTSHLGPTPAQADNCILHYYNWLGDIAR
jgi:hypothetical protein